MDERHVNDAQRTAVHGRRERQHDPAIQPFTRTFNDQHLKWVHAYIPAHRLLTTLRMTLKDQLIL